MSENRLHLETSPYLLQHKDNPVHWRPWGTAAFGEAHTTDKPILLSVGYAACHWCHVMAHESFEDDHTADLINELYIPVKVDREEFPHVDALYQKALQMMGEGGGWPLTMFLTPDGTPFFGGTYFPLEERYGRPGFKDVLSKIALAYHGKPEVIADNGKRLKMGLYQIYTSSLSGDLNPDILVNLANQIMPMMDRDQGGLKGAPKFPMTPVFDLLWQAGNHPSFKDKTANADDMIDAVTTTLDNLCQGGIYDHVGGGFARYSVDDKWLVPHFEKMLYDNAALISLLTKAWVKTKNPLYQSRVTETIRWLEREMITNGAFAAAQDADSEGVEGKYYVWQKSEIEKLLTKDEANLFCHVYDITDDGNWEGNNIPNRLHTMAALSKDEEHLLSAAREKLLNQRLTRIPPLTDDKILADWNGMMITALTEAGTIFNQPSWIKLAEEALKNSLKILKPDQQLFHSWRDQKHGPLALLSDYAWLAFAASSLFEATNNHDHLALAESLSEKVISSFQSPEGSYYLNAPESLDIMMPLMDASDNVTASPQAIFLMVLTRLYAFTGKQPYFDAGEKLIKAHGGDITQHGFSHASLITASHYFYEHVSFIIVGNRKDKTVQNTIAAIYDLALDHKIIQLVDEGEKLPDNHPAFGKETSEKGCVFICTQNRCSTPITEINTLSDHLKDFI